MGDGEMSSRFVPGRLAIERFAQADEFGAHS